MRYPRGQREPGPDAQGVPDHVPENGPVRQTPVRALHPEDRLQPALHVGGRPVQLDRRVDLHAMEQAPEPGPARGHAPSLPRVPELVLGSREIGHRLEIGSAMSRAVALATSLFSSPWRWRIPRRSSGCPGPGPDLGSRPCTRPGRPRSRPRPVAPLTPVQGLGEVLGHDRGQEHLLGPGIGASLGDGLFPHPPDPRWQR